MKKVIPGRVEIFCDGCNLLCINSLSNILSENQTRYILEGIVKINENVFKDGFYLDNKFTELDLCDICFNAVKSKIIDVLALQARYKEE